MNERNEITHQSISTLRFADRLKGMKVDQIVPSAAEREAEMHYMNALKSHQQVAMEMKIARDVFDYENQLSDVSVSSESFQSVFRERLLFCKKNAGAIKEGKIIEKEKKVLTEVEVCCYNSPFPHVCATQRPSCFHTNSLTFGCQTLNRKVSESEQSMKRNRSKSLKPYGIQKKFSLHLDCFLQQLDSCHHGCSFTYMHPSSFSPLK
jgi:hypothetical protein